MLSSDTLIRLSSDPGYIEKTCTDGRIIVIDEIQKLPSLLDEVHRLTGRRGFRFPLTGSSARQLRRKGVNLLGGKARVKRLHPFSASEPKDLFDLDRAVNYGLAHNGHHTQTITEDFNEIYSSRPEFSSFNIKKLVLRMRSAYQWTRKCFSEKFAKQCGGKTGFQRFRGPSRIGHSPGRDSALSRPRLS